jgi:transcriptional antiterminator RfaH
MSTAYDDTARWYAIYTNPKEEARADENLKAWSVITFAPWVRQRSKGDKPSAYVTKPLFPRYIFARFNATESLHAVRFTRGVRAVVSFGRDPAPISDDVIGFIQSHAGEDGYINLTKEFQPGEKVRITGGRFHDMRGIFLRDVDDARRVLILLETIQFQARAVIDREQISRVN